MKVVRPCWAEVDPAALQNNWRTLRGKLAKDVQMLAVVKADGYGLGLLNVSKIAVEEGAVYLGVSSVEEGMALRASGVSLKRCLRKEERYTQPCKLGYTHPVRISSQI